MVLVIFTLGRYLEALGRARALRSLAPLLAAEEAKASVIEDGRESLRPARAVAPGTLVRVKPGARVPVDGIVVEGESDRAERVLTGPCERRAKSSEERRVGQVVGSTWRSRWSPDPYKHKTQN